MDTQEDRRVDERLCLLLDDNVPEKVESRLRSQFASLRDGAFQDASVQPRTSGRTRRSLLIRLTVSSIAVAVVAVVWSVVLQPSRGLAQVANAVLQKRWVHIETTISEGPVIDAWWSPSSGIAASRSKDFTRFENLRNQVYELYKPDEDRLYRSPVVGTSESSRSASHFESLRMLFQSDRVSEKQFDEVFRCGPSIETTKILEQQVEEVESAGRKWLDYHLKVRTPDELGVVDILFHVDAESKLPAVVRFEGQLNGKRVKRESTFDYPEQGPVDIYALGVPRTATFIDRVPSEDLKRIADILRSDRIRMDDYRMVFVNPSEIGEEWWWRNSFPQVFYRKGDRFRRDFIAKTLPEGMEPKEPDANVDRREWWINRAKQFEYFPHYVQAGPVYYLCSLKQQEASKEAEHVEIGSVESHKRDMGEPWPIDYAMRPEFVCRVLMGLGNEDQEAKLVQNPTDGPAGCIQIDIHRTTKRGRMNEKGIGVTDLQRFWLDPRQDYLVKRWDMVMIDAVGEESIHLSHIVEESAQSPKGVWYAIKVRRKNDIIQKDGKRYDDFYVMYVDFNVNLPDSLFAPPKVGTKSQRLAWD